MCTIYLVSLIFYFCVLRNGRWSKAISNLSFCSDGRLAPASNASCCPEVGLCTRLECSQVRCGAAPCSTHTRFPPPAHLGCCPAYCPCGGGAHRDVDAVAAAAANAASCLEGVITSVLNFNETADPWEGEDRFSIIVFLTV